MSDSLFEFYNHAVEVDNSDYIWGANWGGQTFTPSVGHTITSVKLFLKRAGTVSGNFVVSIQATTSSKPNGTEICTGSIVASTVGTSAYTEYEITLGSSSGALEASTMYAIVVNATGGTNNENSIQFFGIGSGEGEYTGGNWNESGDSGASWSITANEDHPFKEYGTPTIQNIDLIAEVGALTLTGQDATFQKPSFFNLVCEVGRCILTGFDIIFQRTGGIWFNQGQSEDISASNASKTSISATNSAKTSISPSNSAKTSISPANSSKNSISSDNQSKS